MSVPANAVQANGIGAVSDDEFNTFVQTCATAAQLRNFIGVASMAVMLQGISGPGDNLAGFFYWATGTGFTDDNRNTIVPPGAASGAWIRLTVAAP